MPEGPEIKRVADKLSSALVGKKIYNVRFLYPAISKAYSLVKDFKILSVSSIGKALIINFENGYSLYSHNQLYGKWTVNLKDTNSRTNRSLRVEFITEKKAVRLWSATEILIIPTSGVNENSYIKNLGPDILNESVDYVEIKKRLSSSVCKNRMVAHILLDQKAFAGIGNYLRSEILFSANLNPYKKPKDLDCNSLSNFAKSIKKISLRAYKNNGITVSDNIRNKGISNKIPRRQWKHYVFCRNNMPCFKCSETISRIRVSGRRLDYCPSCQK